MKSATRTLRGTYKRAGINTVMDVAYLMAADIMEQLHKDAVSTGIPCEVPGHNVDVCSRMILQDVLQFIASDVNIDSAEITIFILERHHA